MRRNSVEEQRMKTIHATANAVKNRRLSRRDVLRTGTAFGLAVPILASPIAVPRSFASQGSDDPLVGEGEVVVYSNGGSFTEGVRREVFEPFTALTGIE